MSNAIKYSPAGGPVTVTLHQEDGPPAAAVQVEDPGMGIPEAELDRIFERFYRASNVSGPIGGTGVGLTAGRQTVELHGGANSVRSSEGRGSTVVVRLPLQRAGERRSPGPHPSVTRAPPPEYNTF